MAIYEVKEGDTGTKVRYVLEDEAGAVNLANASALKVYVKRDNGTYLINGSVGAVEVAASGEVSYTTASSGADTAEKDDFPMETEVTWIGGTKTRFPSKGYDTWLVSPKL